MRAQGAPLASIVVRAAGFYGSNRGFTGACAADTFRLLPILMTGASSPDLIEPGGSGSCAERAPTRYSGGRWPADRCRRSDLIPSRPRWTPSSGGRWPRPAPGTSDRLPVAGEPSTEPPVRGRDALGAGSTDAQAQRASGHADPWRPFGEPCTTQTVLERTWSVDTTPRLRSKRQHGRRLPDHRCARRRRRRGRSRRSAFVEHQRRRRRLSLGASAIKRPPAAGDGRLQPAERRPN